LENPTGDFEPWSSGAAAPFDPPSLVPATSVAQVQDARRISVTWTEAPINDVLLAFAAFSGMLGSGWLFGPMNAAQVAGPAAVLAWVIGGIAMLILAISFALKQVKGFPEIWIVYVALGTVTWITLCRLIRGEVMKHKNRDYVVAAKALGGGHLRSMIRHILPNVFHLVIIRFSLQFVFAIETEVILAYLGVGLSDPSIASWGRMINDAKQELIRGEFGNITGATLALFGLALAFNLLGDGLRDALDPKLNQ